MRNFIFFFLVLIIGTSCNNANIDMAEIENNKTKLESTIDDQLNAFSQLSNETKTEFKDKLILEDNQIVSAYVGGLMETLSDKELNSLFENILDAPVVITKSLSDIDAENKRDCWPFIILSGHKRKLTTGTCIPDEPNWYCFQCNTDLEY